MKKEYKILGESDRGSIYTYKLYCDGSLVNEYIDKKVAENVKVNLEEVDKLKEDAPDFEVLDILEKFIKST